MTHVIRLCVFAGALAAVYGLPPLASTTSNQAVAQISIVVPGVNRSYYNGYSPHYNRGYLSVYGRRAYTGYGSGPYGYGSPTMFGNRSTTRFGNQYSRVYGYQRGTSQSLYYRGVRLHGGTYQPIYNPNTTRYYSPYGYGDGYGGY
jgi:hypothetical protein